MSMGSTSFFWAFHPVFRATNRWPFSTRIHGPTLKSSRPESSTVELRDPHSLDAELPEEPEEAAEPKMEKSKSLKERLEELSSNSHWDFSWFLFKMDFLFWMF